MKIELSGGSKATQQSDLRVGLIMTLNQSGVWYEARSRKNAEGNEMR